MVFPDGSDSKESACNAGDLGFTPVVGRSPGERNSTRYSILAWRTSWTEEPGCLNFNFNFFFGFREFEI